MPSSLKRKLALRNAKAVDRSHGEQVELKFKNNQTNDPTRPDETIIAVLKYGELEVSSLGGGRTRDWSASVAHEAATLIVDRQKYDHLTFKCDDVIRAIEDPKKPLFKVTHVGHTTARWVLALEVIK